MSDKKNFWTRLKKSSRDAIAPAFQAVIWLLSLIIPVSFIVAVLGYTGVLAVIAQWLHPLMQLLGLPGESALVLLTAAGLNLYSAIAVMQTISLTVKQATILALISLIAHNLPVEVAVQRRVGASAVGMLTLRVLAGLGAGIFLNLCMPENSAALHTTATVSASTLPLLLVLKNWAFDLARLAVKIIVIVTALMLIQRWLAEFGLLKRLARWLHPLLALLGLPRSTAFLWLAANCMGLAYGAAVMHDYAKTGDIANKDLQLFNCHVAIAHSLPEDTLLFAAIGVPVFWILWPRLALAALVVWAYRLSRFITQPKKVLET